MKDKRDWRQCSPITSSLKVYIVGNGLRLENDSTVTWRRRSAAVLLWEGGSSSSTIKPGSNTYPWTPTDLFVERTTTTVILLLYYIEPPSFLSPSPPQPVFLPPFWTRVLCHRLIPFTRFLATWYKWPLPICLRTLEESPRGDFHDFIRRNVRSPLYTPLTFKRRRRTRDRLT